ncbi:MAG: SDR family oxidoreductase [Thermotogae bacterium]|nr:SDR family oxidoreductase [Thermotogota bacterium]
MRRVILITGGTRGIGLAIGKAFEKEGFKVFVTGTRPHFEGFNYIRADVRSFVEMEEAVRKVDKPIDVLVANAGKAYVGSVEKTDPQTWRELIDINLTGVFNTVKATLPYMNKGGHIFIMGSIASIQGFAGWSAYCASKFGVLGFARAIAEELKGRLKVSIILPGAVDTDLWNHLAYVPPKGKMLKAEDVAKAVLDAYNNRGWIKEVLILPEYGII